MKPELSIQPVDRNAAIGLPGRRVIVSGAVASAVALVMTQAYADPRAINPVDVSVSEGGFRYIPDPASPFSGGVAALAGHALTRVSLRRPLALEQGLDLVLHYLAGVGSKPSALAGLELRSPSVMTRSEFRSFNERYVSALHSRGFGVGPAVPVARSNIVPLYDPPRSVVVHAFTYAAPGNAGDAGFLLSGRPEQSGNHVLAPGDVSAAGMRQKARFVIDQLRQSVTMLGGRWADLTALQVYSVQPLFSIVDALQHAGLGHFGPQYFMGSPPVIGPDGFRYEFEADARAIGIERVI